jgi:hypothetical protein
VARLSQRMRRVIVYEGSCYRLRTEGRIVSDLVKLGQVGENLELSTVSLRPEL